MSSALQQKVKRFLVDNGYTHTDFWLTECLDWIRENYKGAKEEEVKKHVVEQWKDVDLMEVKCSCLPPNLGAKKCTTLNGKFGLQMNSIQDIGESAYSQYKQIKRLENDNAAVSAEGGDRDNFWAPKARRCLYLSLTDGTQKVFGLELTTISTLHMGLVPGVKILVTGPVECRRGVLQLHPQNVKIIGGEVESLFKHHCVEAVINRKIDKPDDDISRPTQRQSSISNTTNNVVTEDDGFPDDDDDDLFMQIDETQLIA